MSSLNRARRDGDDIRRCYCGRRSNNYYYCSDNSSSIISSIRNINKQLLIKSLLSVLPTEGRTVHQPLFH